MCAPHVRMVRIHGICKRHTGRYCTVLRHSYTGNSEARSANTVQTAHYVPWPGLVWTAHVNRDHRAALAPGLSRLLVRPVVQRRASRHVGRCLSQPIPSDNAAAALCSCRQRQHNIEALYYGEL